jgi:hypothetical protein
MADPTAHTAREELADAGGCDEDFFLWTQRQARLLRERRFTLLDAENLAQEIEDMGKRDRRELESRLRVLVMHLLKWQFQPRARSGSWRATIREQRKELSKLLADSPSLRREVERYLQSSYPDALANAADETGLPRSTFPAALPYTDNQVLDPTYMPEAASSAGATTRPGATQHG